MSTTQPADRPVLIHAAPSPAVLPADSGLLRVIRRPELPAPQSFTDAFEARALVYDAFWTADGERILLVGPPPLNLAPAWREARIEALPGRASLRARRFVSVSQMIVELRGAPPATTAIRLDIAGQVFELPLPTRGPSGFEGRRVLFTMSRNNDLAWIREWASYHTRTQGTDAVILFDNRSDRYLAGDIIDTLRAVDGLKAIAVPEWPWAFGAFDTRVKADPYWSHFLQNSSMSVVLRRLGPAAHSLLNCDVDELVHAGPGRSIHDLVRASRTGFLTFKGQWIEPVTDPSVPLVGDHRDFRHRLIDEKQRRSANNKWALDPTRPWLRNLRVHPYWHWLAGRPPFSKEQRSDVLYWHFKGINTNWKNQRATDTRFDPLRHEADPILVSQR